MNDRHCPICRVPRHDNQLGYQVNVHLTEHNAGGRVTFDNNCTMSCCNWCAAITPGTIIHHTFALTGDTETYTIL